MRKKVRSISIGDHTFTWRVARVDPSTVVVRVWAAQEPRSTWAEFRLPMEDAWLGFGSGTRRSPEPPITPATVAALIEARLRSG